MRIQKRDIHEVGVMISIIILYGVYLVSSPFHRMADRIVQPFTAGLAAAYSNVSSALYARTGIDLGFVVPRADPNFITRVQIATCIKERQAQPLIDLAMDQLRPVTQREDALRALLRFPSSSDWIRPFLNDLPKGGMVGLYDEHSTVIDDVMKQIRLEGGIQKPLIRAFAEVSISFMLQVPDVIVRRKAMGWVSDVMGEDALNLILPRVLHEADPTVRHAIEDALWDVRAISDPSNAVAALQPLYKKPPWPELKLPLAVLLARLANQSASKYLEAQLNSVDLTEKEKVSVRVALAHTKYPEHILVSTNAAPDPWAAGRRARETQRMAALTTKQEILSVRVTPPVEIKRIHVVKASPKIIPVAPLEQPTTPAVVDEPIVSEPEKIVPPAPTVEPETPVVASLSPETVPALPPPVEEPQTPPSSMHYVDVIFEVKDGDVPLYANPGDAMPSSVIIPVGSKGKASFEVDMNEEKWFQVKSKDKTGWAKGALLKIYDLSPSGSTPVADLSTNDSDKSGSRQEATYFEATNEAVVGHESPDEKSKHVATLKENVPYLAERSEKVGADRWFLLKIDEGAKAWVRGVDLQLSNNVPASVVKESKEAAEPQKSQSFFAAQWVVAGVNGVLVYNRPSIAGKVVESLSPPTIYKVVETSSGGGDEWYKVKLSGKKEGWVQVMDVNLTKPQ